MKKSVTVTIKNDEPTIANLSAIKVEIANENSFVNTNIDNSVKMYLNSVFSVPMLTDEQTDYLLTVCRDGEHAIWARNELIAHNLRMVVSIARKYYWFGIDFLDLVQDGTFGIVKAIERFDSSKGFKFSTYAYWWINREISRTVNETRNAIRVPNYMVELQIKVNKAIEHLSANGEKPTAETVANFLNMEVDKVMEVMEVCSDVGSLDVSIGSDDDETTLADTIADTDTNAPYHNAEMADLRERLETLLDSVLKERDARIMKLRFGFVDGVTYTYEQIGAEFGMKKNGVKMIETRSLEKIRKSGKADTLIEFLR